MTKLDRTFQIKDEKAGLYLMIYSHRGTQENFFLEPSLSSDEQYDFLQKLLDLTEELEDVQQTLEAADYLIEAGAMSHAQEVCYFVGKYLLASYTLPFTAAIDLGRQQKQFEVHKPRRSLRLVHCPCEINIHIYGHNFTLGEWEEGHNSNNKVGLLEDFFDTPDLMEIWQAGNT